MTAETLDQERIREAIATRDRRFDGAFVFAVRTTGVYCRPSCPAKRPKPRNIVVYASNAEARDAGYRPCRRCRPDDPVRRDEALAARARRLIDEAEEESPTLAGLAASLGMSSGHLQRVFKRVLGMTPREYAAAARLHRFKAGLREGTDVTSALYEAGYGSSSRVYENANRLLGMTPGAYRRGGAGLCVRYGISDSPLGKLLVAVTDRGVCFVAMGDTEAEAVDGLRGELPRAELQRAESEVEGVIDAFLAYLKGEEREPRVPLDLRGSEFQLLVWKALRALPYGATTSYKALAASIGRLQAARAVARACATNPVPLAVPCHRVLASDGGLAGYRWQPGRKRALLALEASGGATPENPSATEVLTDA
ncbi:MAG TPA: bifunctional DNA-binding transcriptional regulator/O6-methylguanine-DNA methyltransferase Ada [Dehalococcoidia bacterium]|nr:bifunctional DNA-binding transcriptional regulator/O6-methylguanine-DNA methyltransferase Ada [Dehalococcoidia bacterium]